MEKKFAKVVASMLVFSMLGQSVPATITAEASEGKAGIAKIQAKSASGHGAELATDGQPDTYWQSIPSSGEGNRYARMYDHNRYIDIALDGTYDLSEIKIFNQTDGSFNNYYVYASTDGENYQKIIAKTSDAAATAEGDVFQVDATASYLRLNMAYNSNSFATNLAEIEVYGTRTGDVAEVSSEIQVENWQGSKWQEEWDKFESDSKYAEKKVLAEMTNLVGRVLGEKWKSSFVFQFRGNLSDEKDVFELSDGSDGTIVIKGNNGLSMASGLNYYLKNYAGVDYNPLYESNVSMEKIVPLKKKIVKEAQFDLRYALNFCTYSYTMAFWNWDEYEEFLDWCAMNGINLVLDIVGQEEVIRQTLKEFHYTDAEIKDYISGPAYFAWFYMQNLYSIGGPLPNAWFEQRVELGRKMHDRMQTYGITPVIQGFAGQVPETFAEKNEGAVLTPIDEWVGYTRPSIIKTYLTDDEVAQGKKNYFADAARVFYEKQKNVFGDVSDYYAADPFHEGGNVGTLDVANIYKVVQDEMLRSNPNAVWVMQQWQGNLNADKMSQMDTSKALALDLQADMNPQHGLFEENGTPWIYCMLHNFGGRMGLDGEVPVIAKDPVETYHKTKNMSGIGITPEALENSPVVYELLFDTTWSKDPIDYHKWIEKYAKRRAGGTTDSLQAAWDILVETAYADKGIYYQGAAETVINSRPGDSFGSASTWGHSNILYDKAELDKALLLLAENYEAFSQSPAFKYDLADVAEQVLCNAAVEYHKLMVQAKNAGDLAEFEKLSASFLSLIDLSDQILSTTEEFLLGTWIDASRKMITDADDWTKDLFEFNARSLVTTWGGERVGSLKDYSNRKWAGLTSGFYKERWEIWIRNRTAELKGEAKNPADQKAESNWFMWEYQWANRKSDDENGKYAYTANASDADLGALAQKVYEEFSYTNLEKNTGGTAEEKVNVAKGKPVTTTSETQSGNITNVNDGTTSTEWIARGEGPHTIEIDLEGSYQVQEMLLSIPQLAKEFPYTYRVEIYNPASNAWEMYAEYTDAKMESNVNISKEAEATKVRLTMTTGDMVDSPLTITDIAVYGKALDVKQYYNLAAGKLANTNKTNTDAGYPLTNITDEKPETFWKTTDWGNNAYPADVSVDLGGTANVEYVDLYFEKPGLPFIFYVTVTDAENTEHIVFDKYKNHDGIMDSAHYRIDVKQDIRAVNVHMTGITGKGEAYAAGPAIAEIMVMSTSPMTEGPAIDFTEGKIDGITVQGGNAGNSSLDGNKESWDLVTKDAEITFDLGRTHYVKNAAFTFEKSELGLRYMVYAEDESGQRTLISDQSKSSGTLGNREVSVPVNMAVRKIVFIHMGNNGDGPAYAAETRLYEFEAFGGRPESIAKGAVTEPQDANVLTDGKTDTGYQAEKDTAITMTLPKAADVNMVSVLRSAESGDPLRYVVEYLDEDAKKWSVFADLSGNTDAAQESFAVAAKAVYTKQLRFTFSEGVEISELRVYDVDRTGPLVERIKAVRKTLEDLKYDGYNGSYTEEAKTVLETVLNTAEEALDAGMNSKMVEEWIGKIDDALATFYRTGIVYVSREELLVALSDAQAMAEVLGELGMKDAQAVLQTAYHEAREVYDTYKKTQPEIDEATDFLLQSMEKMMQTLKVMEQAQVKLAEAKKRVENAVVGDVEGNYPQEAVQALQSVITAAENSLQNPKDDAAIQNVIQTLDEAMTAFAESVVKVDKSELNGAIAEAEETVSGTKADYDVDTWKAYQAALAEAKKMADSEEPVSQAAVNAAKEALNTAKTNLQLLNKTALATKLTELEQLEEKAYLVEAWEAFLAEKADAEAVLQSEELKQQMLDEAVQKLNTAADALAEKHLTKTELYKLLEELQDLEKADYTADSWEKFTEVKTSAEKLLADGKVTQEAHDTTLAALKEAQGKLSLKPQEPGEPEQPEEPEKPGKPERPTKPDGDKNNGSDTDSTTGDKSVKTGDAANGSFYFWMILAACGVMAYAGQCRKDKMCQKNNRKK